MNGHHQLVRFRLTGTVFTTCVTFNNNSGSTKSYDYVREHIDVTGTMDFVPMMREITATYEAGDVSDITMHDGTVIRLHKVDKHWDPLNRISAMRAVQTARGKGEVLTGLLYMDPNSSDLHDMLNTSERPLNSLGKDALCPGSDALAKLNSSLR